MERQKKSEFIPARSHAPLSPGEVIRMLGELKGWTQADLAERSGITTTNISLLENQKGRSARGVQNNLPRRSACALP